MSLSLARVGVLALALATSACDDPPKRSTVDAAPSANPAPAVTPAKSAAMPRPPPPRATGCRTLAIRGDVRVGATPVSVGMMIDGTRWLELQEGAEVSFRHAQTTRELTVKGPGRALACADGEEDFILARGALQTSAGPGARPGAQVTVYTPFGTVSYGDARIDIRASAAKLDVRVSKGEAWLLAATGSRRAGPETVTGPKGRGTLAGPAAATALAEACEEAATRAEQLAQSVLDPSAAGPDAGSLGDRAAAHLRARQAARAACGSARAAAARSAEDATRRDLERRLLAADRRWKAVGSPPAPAPKPSAG